MPRRRWRRKGLPLVGLVGVAGTVALALARAAWADPRGAALPVVVVRHATGTVEIHGLDPGSGMAALLAAAAARAASELPVRLGVDLPPRVHVVYCAEARTFARLAGRAAAGRLLGVARPADSLAALNGPLLQPGPENGAAGTLRHELAHLALGIAAERAGPLPRWFDEGAASWFAGGFAELGPLDLAAAAGRPGLGLGGLADGFPEDPDGARIAYARSQLALELLEREHGAGTVAGLGRALAAGVPFAAAPGAVAGESEAGLDRALARSLAPHGLLLAVLRRSLSPVMVMAGLVVVGFAIRRLRYRRRLRQWQREEERSGEGREP